jgi:hypothetical protein
MYHHVVDWIWKRKWVQYLGKPLALAKASLLPSDIRQFTIGKQINFVGLKPTNLTP